MGLISVRPTQPFGPRPPLGGKKIFQKEQPVMVKKPSLSIHIELYIIYPFPNNKYWRTFFSFFHLRKVILPDFSLLGFKRKRIWIWKRKNFLGRRKKSLLVRPCKRPPENCCKNLSACSLKTLCILLLILTYVHFTKIVKPKA